MFLFDWATMPVQNFVPKLGAAWAGFYLLLGLPVSAFTFDVHKELVQCLAAASAGSSFVVTVLVWRLYLVGVVVDELLMDCIGLQQTTQLEEEAHQHSQYKVCAECWGCAQCVLCAAVVAHLGRA